MNRPAVKRAPRGMFVRDEREYEELLASGIPHDPRAESALLGAIILDNKLMGQAIEAGISDSTFYVRANQFIWPACVILWREGTVINPITIGDVLRREGQLQQVGGIANISDLTNEVYKFGFTNVATFAKIMLDHAKVRDALRITRYNEALLLEGGLPADELLAQVEANTLEVVGAALRDKKSRSQEFTDVGEDEEEFERAIVGYHEGVTDAIETPIKWLNDKLEGGGLQKQGIYLIAAPPKVGKTSLMLWFADFMARMERPGGLISMEMRRLALEKRLFARYAGIPFWMMRKGFHGPEYEQALKKIKPFFASLRKRLFIVDSISTMPQIRHAARRLVHGPTQAEWLALDYLQLASSTDSPDPHQRAQEVGAVSRDAKVLAQELNVPIIVISSLNQEGEREGRRPELTDLYWSGQMRYDAEAILFLHNPDYKRAMTREERIAFDELKLWNVDLILAAQRNGPTGEVRLQFVREYMQFNVPEPVKAPQWSGPKSPEPDFDNPTPSFLTPDVDSDEPWLD